MKIKRSTVLKAIRHEPLKYGDWIYGRCDSKGNFVVDKKCQVCAVGATLRVAGVKPTAISEYARRLLLNTLSGVASYLGDEKAELEAGNYLMALSIKFEKLAVYNGAGNKTRRLLSNWVKKNLPAVISTWRDTTMAEMNISIPIESIKTLKLEHNEILIIKLAPGTPQTTRQQWVKVFSKITGHDKIVVYASDNVEFLKVELKERLIEQLIDEEIQK